MEVEFKPPLQENGTKADEKSSIKEPTAEVETNGTVPDSPKASETKKTKRGRHKKEDVQKIDEGTKKDESSTKNEEPKKLTLQLKKIEEPSNGKDATNSEETVNNGKEKKQTKAEETKQVNGKEPTKLKEKAPKEKDIKNSNKIDTEIVEMEPLVLISDEPDPELVFDENSDLESGKGSPILSRCKTRRSQTRNIPTPKTPRSLEEESDKNTTPTPVEVVAELVEIDLESPKFASANQTIDSLNSNSSTKAEVGSDATRLDYMGGYDSGAVSEDSAYLNASRDRSLSDTLRSLSSRRTIRPISHDYRKRAIINNQDKSDLNLPFSGNSLDRINTGIKRKSRSITPEERKKFKGDSPGLMNLFTSPLASLRNKFRNDLPSSTPKLTGFKDTVTMVDYGEGPRYAEGAQNGVDKKNWCTLM